MKQITLSYSGGTYLLLGENGGESVEGPFNFSISGAIRPQVQQFLRAETVKLFSRKNRVITISYEADRVHASVNAAQNFLLSEAMQMPDEDDMICKITPHGTGASPFFLTTPFVTQFPGRQIGLRTRHRYEITGGALTLSF